MRLTNLAYLFGFAALVSLGCGGSTDNKTTTAGSTAPGGTTGGNTGANGGSTGTDAGISTPDAAITGPDARGTATGGTATGGSTGTGGATAIGGTKTGGTIASGGTIVTGGAVATGGAGGGNASGGTTATGGTRTGGTIASGGVTVATGGAGGSASGGTPATGGTTGTGGTGGTGSCPAIPSCVTAVMNNCLPAGACTTSGDMLTTPMVACYANGVKLLVAIDPQTMEMTMTYKKGGTVCFTGSGPIVMAGPTTFEFKDGAGKTVFTGTTAPSTGDDTRSTTYACPDGSSATVSGTCDTLSNANATSEDCTASADCTL